MTENAVVSQKLQVTGHVQGVGFRPFIFRLANQFQLTGQVKNLSGQVEILVQGPQSGIDAFSQALIEDAPPLAKPVLENSHPVDSPLLKRFTIEASEAVKHSNIQVPPDFFMCDDCKQELHDPQQRRYRYPFTNCTQCGPRYTIIRQFPYDRPNTSMQDFVLCPDCHDEYSNPLDRRFHAQPLACAKCGPSLSFLSADIQLNNTAEALAACVKALHEGKIIAVKGIGGYHLVCDALNSEAIQILRNRKQRPDKPLAVMFPWMGKSGLDSVLQYTSANEPGVTLLTSPQRPIVLLKKKPGLPDNIAPGIKEIGAMLPYSPLHEILLSDFAGPLIATSGNISGEPVLTDNTEAEKRLSKIADGFLQHNRPIIRPADDSVIRVINNQPSIIRAGRGMAPMEFKLPGKLEKPVLAVGGHMKTTIALAWQNRIVISPHISDLGTRRSMDVFQQVLHDLQQLYQVNAKHIICDSHPGYQSHQWAKQQPVSLTQVDHHIAHAAIISGQYPQIKNWLMFCWDGVGLGSDKTLWGGETFHGSSEQWQRTASLKPFYLPGGDKAGRQPWRSAAALHWECNDDWQSEITDIELAHTAWNKKINCPQTSAVGRLFDAAAQMILGIDRVSFEGQAAMMLEAAIDKAHNDAISLPLVYDEQRLLRINWQPLIKPLQDKNLSASYRACLFHNSLAHNIIDQAEYFKNSLAFEGIGLSGGVFQNRYLVEKVIALAERKELPIYISTKIPVNDAGLSYGQVIEYLYQQMR